MIHLPVIETAKDAIGYTLSNISLLLRAALVWVVMYIILVAIFDFLGGEAYIEAFRQLGVDTQIPDAADPVAPFTKLFDTLDSMGSAINAVYVAMFVLGVLAYYGIAIAWHRACLLDENPPMIRLGKLELKYLFISILLAIILYALFVLISVAVAYSVSFAFGSVDGAMIGTFVSIGLLMVVMLLAFGRFSLAFPGIAVRDRRMNLRTSFSATKGNSWRILGGTLLCIIPILILSLIVSLIDGVGLPLIITLPLAMMINLLGGAFILSFMSICYQTLVPSPDEGDLA